VFESSFGSCNGSLGCYNPTDKAWISDETEEAVLHISSICQFLQRFMARRCPRQQPAFGFQKLSTQISVGEIGASKLYLGGSPCIKTHVYDLNFVLETVLSLEPVRHLLYTYMYFAIALYVNWVLGSWGLLSLRSSHAGFG
jgi:hypothetical protein